MLATILAKQIGLMKMSKKRNNKAVTPKRIPTSVEDFTPYIESLKASVERDTEYLEWLNSGKADPNPRVFGMKTIEEIFDKINYARNFRNRVIHNWETWVAVSAPVAEFDGKIRDVITLDDPESEWYSELNGEDYFRDLTKHTGKWRDVMKLRGCQLKGNAYKVDSLIKTYLAVTTAYTYKHGFSSWDEFAIAPYPNWRYKMGAYTWNGQIGTVFILK